MYSHVYVYYLLRSDAVYSRPVATHRAVEACERAGMRVAAEPLAFVGAPGFPWCSVSLVRADASGNYHSDPNAREVNAAPFVGLRSVPSQPYEALLREIASTLGWQLLLEDDDEGRENVLLFEPT